MLFNMVVWKRRLVEVMGEKDSRDSSVFSFLFLFFYYNILVIKSIIITKTFYNFFVEWIMCFLCYQLIVVFKM